MIKILESDEDLFDEVLKRIQDAKIPCTVRGNKMKKIMVPRKYLDKASKIRNEIDPKYTVTVASQA